MDTTPNISSSSHIRTSNQQNDSPSSSHFSTIISSNQNDSTPPHFRTSNQNSSSSPIPTTTTSNQSDSPTSSLFCTSNQQNDLFSHFRTSSNQSESSTRSSHTPQHLSPQQLRFRQRIRRITQCADARLGSSSQHVPSWITFPTSSTQSPSTQVMKTLSEIQGERKRNREPETNILDRISSPPPPKRQRLTDIRSVSLTQTTNHSFSFTTTNDSTIASTPTVNRSLSFTPTSNRSISFTTAFNRSIPSPLTNNRSIPFNDRSDLSTSTFNRSDLLTSTFNRSIPLIPTTDPSTYRSAPFSPASTTPSFTFPEQALSSHTNLHRVSSPTPPSFHSSDNTSRTPIRSTHSTRFRSATPHPNSATSPLDVDLFDSHESPCETGIHPPFSSLDDILILSPSDTSLNSSNLNNSTSKSLSTTSSKQKSSEKTHGIAKENTSDCSICYDSIQDKGTISCGHEFCFSCISEWSKKSNVCPLCRQRYHEIQRKSDLHKENVKIPTRDFHMGPNYASLLEALQARGERLTGHNVLRFISGDGIVFQINQRVNQPERRERQRERRESNVGRSSSVVDLTRDD